MKFELDGWAVDTMSMPLDGDVPIIWHIACGSGSEKFICVCPSCLLIKGEIKCLNCGTEIPDRVITFGRLLV